MAINYSVPPLQIGVTYFDNWGRPAPAFQRYWQEQNNAIKDSFGQISDVLDTQAAQQADIVAAQADIVAAQAGITANVAAIAAQVAALAAVLNGTTNFTGIKVDNKRVDNFVDSLASTGDRIEDTAALPLNVPSGAARSYDSYPLTSTSSAISIASVGADEPGSSGSIASGSVSGLSADVPYRVFYSVPGGFYTAQPSPAGAYFSSPDGWKYIGDIKTKTGGGVYSAPAALPPGFDPGYNFGGMNIF